MTEEEGNYYITLAALHAPSTVGDIDITNGKGTYTGPERGTHDPLNRTIQDCWWVYRAELCRPDFNTRAEAARHYCRHYGLIKP